MRCYDAFLDGFHLNIVMEYCTHGDLHTFLLKRVNTLLSEMRIWKFFIQIVLGVDALHSKKILHRDLKTLNIFLTKRDMLKIGDFGNAKSLDQGSVATKKVGTPYYLSPEVCEGKNYDEKSDIWSVGVILYEMSTLTRPFDGENEEVLSEKIIKGKFK